MRYLLDTNVVSDLVRNPQGRIAERIRKVGEVQVCTSIIVAAEFRYGARRRDRHASRRSSRRCSAPSTFYLSRRPPTQPTA